MLYKVMFYHQTKPVAAGINSQLSRKRSQGASPGRSGRTRERKVIQWLE